MDRPLPDAALRGATRTLARSLRVYALNGLMPRTKLRELVAARTTTRLEARDLEALLVEELHRFGVEVAPAAGAAARGQRVPQDVPAMAAQDAPPLPGLLPPPSGAGVVEEGASSPRAAAQDKSPTPAADLAPLRDPAGCRAESSASQRPVKDPALEPPPGVLRALADVADSEKVLLLLHWAAAEGHAGLDELALQREAARLWRGTPLPRSAAEEAARHGWCTPDDDAGTWTITRLGSNLAASALRAAQPVTATVDARTPVSGPPSPADGIGAGGPTTPRPQTARRRVLDFVTLLTAGRGRPSCTVAEVDDLNLRTTGPRLADAASALQSARLAGLVERIGPNQWRPTATGLRTARSDGGSRLDTTTPSTLPDPVAPPAPTGPEPPRRVDASPWAPPPTPAAVRLPAHDAEDFLRHKQPATAQERAVCLLFWDTVAQGRTSSSPARLDQLNRSTGGRPFSAAGATLQGAMRLRGLVTRGDEPGTWCLTASGRRLVEEGLPRPG